jgi:hypothetical protein
MASDGTLNDRRWDALLREMLIELALIEAQLDAIERCERPVVFASDDAQKDS